MTTAIIRPRFVATLKAARDCGYGKLHVIFQPHRYTRTRDLLAEFARAFDEADSVQMLDIYAASEEPIEGVNAQALVRRRSVVRAWRTRPLLKRPQRGAALLSQEGDAILTLGAGNVSQIAAMVLDRLS